jgi:hypothetical protein
LQSLPSLPSSTPSLQLSFHKGHEESRGKALKRDVRGSSIHQ